MILNPIKNLRILLCGLLITASFTATAAPKPVLHIENWKTKQGAAVYFVAAQELPMVNIKVIFTAGSAYDDQSWGLASLTANTLVEGTSLHDTDQIAAAFDQSGAEFNADANRDVAQVSLRSLSDLKYLTPALQTFTEVLSKANFQEKSLAHIKRQTLASIQQQQEDPMTIAGKEFYRTLYQSHPYAHAIIGAPETINAITKSQVENFYHRYYTAGNAKIIIVGKLTRSNAEKISNQLLADLPSGQAAPTLPTVNTQIQSVTRNISFPSQQTSIVIGQLGATRREDPNYFPLIVGNFVLGEMPLGSILFEQVRNQRGLTYNISSSLHLLTYRGPFTITLQTRAAQTQQALQVTRQALQQYLQQGPTEQQLQLAKQNIIRNFPLNLATNADIASILAQMAINQRSLNYLDTYCDKINAVTADQIKKAFQQLIQPNQMITVTVGKK